MSILVAFFYTPGPHWLPGKALQDQPLAEHAAYMYALHEQGKVAIAGPLLDNTGGLNVFQVATLEEANHLVSHDPAIQAGICVATGHPWHPLINAFNT